MDNVRRPIRHAGEFWDHYGVSAHEPLPGDLLFFSRHGNYPTHVGIVRDSESYIHAPGIDGTAVSLRAITHAAITRHHDDTRQVYVRNPIGFKSPTLPHAGPTYRHHQEIL